MSEHKRKLNRERNKLYRQRERQVGIESRATQQFHRQFIEHEYGHSCAVCERLWFRTDLKKAIPGHQALLQEIGIQTIDVLLCSTFAETLNLGKIPSLAAYNGFRYPPKPDNLPPLNAISTRLISPRIPFMQIRRLRRGSGQYVIVGQIINVPVDVQQMVLSLPRNLSDDHAFNVTLKKHIIHKSSAFSGLVKKSDLKIWLDYLQASPLYKLYRITVNWDEFDNALVKATEQHDLEELDVGNENEMLLAQQQTVLWNEDQYLCIAPGQHSSPLSIIYDEHAEELSFPAIYYGVPREFKLGIRVTPFMIATSEIRRSDRRGATPEHLLYMAVKIMRLRVCRGIFLTYRQSADLEKITREMLQDKRFVEQCVERNFAFLKSIPNSVHYWMIRKKELFSMIRQLGKPTCFLTMSANETRWSDLLNLLHRLRGGVPLDDPLAEFSAAYRANLVNEDAVTCCIYFWKMIQVIIRILQAVKNNPFNQHVVIDYFLRTEFQHRGSPHVHILLWLKNDPQEAVSENMPSTVNLINELCSVDLNLLKDQYYANLQVHKHTFTCYKNDKGGPRAPKCRFNIPYWPCKETRILVPMASDDHRRKSLSQKGTAMKTSLEEQAFDNVEEFLSSWDVTYEAYLDIIRASIKRPTVLFKREITDIWTNTFNPWISNVLKSNMDLQIILDEHSCAAYVVEYVNKTNRGISNLQHQLAELQNEYPDQDYTDLLKRVSLRMLDAVEMSAQEAAWFLLRQPMSKASRESLYIPACTPNMRMKRQKSIAQMESENVSLDSTNVWAENIIVKYENRPPRLHHMCLADFAASQTLTRKRGRNSNQIYREREHNRILSWTNYDAIDSVNYKRSMVLLFHPFVNEHIDLLDHDKFLRIYDEQEAVLFQQRQKYVKCKDMEKEIAENRDLWDASSHLEQEPLEYERYVHEGADLDQGHNNDVKNIKIPQALYAVIKKRTNVMDSATYCREMRRTNFEQRALIKHCISRIHDPSIPPVQIFFTGSAGTGKTFTLKLLMETYNRFAQAHDSQRNVYIAAASTGKAAVALGGTTVHTAFSISLQSRNRGLSFESLQAYRNGFVNIHVVFIDEISMIGAGIFHSINERMKQITGQHEMPFGGMDVIFCGDLRQLPPVRTSAIFEPVKRGFHRSELWQSLGYYPLVKVSCRCKLRLLLYSSKCLNIRA